LRRRAEGSAFPVEKREQARPQDCAGVASEEAEVTEPARVRVGGAEHDMLARKRGKDASTRFAPATVAKASSLTVIVSAGRSRVALRSLMG
jgi:hypothetical protein